MQEKLENCINLVRQSQDMDTTSTNLKWFVKNDVATGMKSKKYKFSYPKTHRILWRVNQFDNCLETRKQENCLKIAVIFLYRTTWSLLPVCIVTKGAQWDQKIRTNNGVNPF